MSREILFKAKRKNWRELPKEEWWVEGDLRQDRDLETAFISGWDYYTSESGLESRLNMKSTPKPSASIRGKLIKMRRRFGRMI